MDNLNENIFSMGDFKLLKFPNEINAFLNGKKFIPITLEVQPTERCNHKCIDCQSRIGLDKETAIEKSLYGCDLDLKSLETIWDNPPKGIIISGNTGEPLVYPQICDLLELIAIHKIPVVLITNGELINKSIASYLVKYCRGIRISLDAFNSDSFKITHGVEIDSWQKVIENIEMLLAERRRLSIDPSICMIGIGYLTSAKSEYGMVSATVLAKKLGVDYIQFRPYHFQNHNVQNTLQICKSYEVNKNFCVYSSNQKYQFQNSCIRNYPMCYASFFYSVLDARADLYTCCHHVGERNASYGNLYKQKWHELQDVDLRKNVAMRFPNKTCIPFCRLHTHNNMLNNMIHMNARLDGDSNVNLPEGHDFFL